MTTAEADKIHSVGFAPWVLEPGPRDEAVGEDCAAPRLPCSDRFSRAAAHGRGRR